jgi:hypothetical protein
MDMSVFYAAAVITTVVILGLYLYAKRLKHLTVKIVILIPAMAFGFYLYLVGYIPELLRLSLTTPVIIDLGVFFRGIVKTLISTAAMMAGREDYGVIRNADPYFLTAAYVIPFFTVHLLAFTVTVMAAITVFGRRIMAVLKRFWRRHRLTYVIFGVNAKSLCLAKSIMKKERGGAPAAGWSRFARAARRWAQSLIHPEQRRFVIFIDENADSAAREQISRMGAVVLSEPIFLDGKLNPAALRKSGIVRGGNRKVYAVVFTESEMTNYSIAEGLWAAAYQHRIPVTRLKGIYIYTDSKSVIEELEAKRLRLHQDSGSGQYQYGLSYFCEEDLAARLLFMKKPPFKRLTFDDTGLPVSPTGRKPSITVFILGFGAVGRRVFENALIRSQFENCAFKAVIVDKNLKAIEGRISQDYPALFGKGYRNDIELDFCPDDIGWAKVYEKLSQCIRRKDGACDIDFIVTALGNANTNIETLTNIKSFLIKNRVSPERLPVLAAHVADKKYQLWSGGRDESIGNISVFGDYDEVYSHEIIIDERLDTMARAVHSLYRQQIGLSWELLPLHLKNSNRAAASYMEAYLHIMKLRLVSESERAQAGAGEMTKEEFMAAVEAQPLLDTLARTEHLRWNAFHFISGWTRKPMDEVSDWESRKDETLKRQSCLIPWEELPQLGTLCDFQESDRNVIRNIAEVIGSYNAIAPTGQKLFISR